MSDINIRDKESWNFDRIQISITIGKRRLIKNDSDRD